MNKAPENEISITRIIDAPRDVVFKAWTDPTHFLNWWLKDSITEIKVNKLNIQPGGVFHYGIETLYGTTDWAKRTYQKNEKPSYLSYIVSPSNEKGGDIIYHLKNSWPLEVLEENGKTIIHIKEKPINATPTERELFKETHQAMQQSCKASFDRLIEYVNTIL